MSSFLM